MKLALLGGTFNPLHNGHLNLAEEVLKEFSYDRILFVPSYIPAHKEVSGNISAEERLHILKISLENIGWALWSDCEISRKGVSYTVDTLMYVHENYDLKGKPGLIIGDDLAEGFHNWRNTDRILEMADLIVAHRLYENEVPLDFPHRYAHNVIFPMSSSFIRNESMTGGDISSWLPFPALKYILENRPYEETAKRN